MTYILGIETSCDETSAAILEQTTDPIQIVSHIIASSATLQAKWGGVIPEQAAREQLKSMIPVIREAFEQANLETAQIDAIAVTVGPGLIGSLLVGVETAKALALAWDKPLIPINHLLGHFYANWIQEGSSRLIPRSNKNSNNNSSSSGALAESRSTTVPSFPFLGLLVSGGHSDLLIFKDHNQYDYLGGTRDDAAGECFDKSARVLGLGGIHGGPKIAELATQGDPTHFPLPTPMTDSHDYDFSFSGLKTAMLYKVQELTNKGQKELTPQQICDLTASLEQAIQKSLVSKTLRAAKEFDISQIVLAGGVAANQTLRRTLTEKFTGQVIIPPIPLCMDNAAMIAAAGFFSEPQAIETVNANPNLSFINTINS